MFVCIPNALSYSKIISFGGNLLVLARFNLAPVEAVHRLVVGGPEEGAAVVVHATDACLGGLQ